MKTPSILLSALMLATVDLRAQIVADGATATLDNVTNSLTGAVTVGTNGAFTLLVLSNNPTASLPSRPANSSAISEFACPEPQLSKLL